VLEDIEGLIRGYYYGKSLTLPQSSAPKGKEKKDADREKVSEEDSNSSELERPVFRSSPDGGACSDKRFKLEMSCAEC